MDQRYYDSIFDNYVIMNFEVGIFNSNSILVAPGIFPYHVPIKVMLLDSYPMLIGYSHDIELLKLDCSLATSITNHDILTYNKSTRLVLKNDKSDFEYGTY